MNEVIFPLLGIMVAGLLSGFTIWFLGVFYSAAQKAFSE